MEKYPFYKVAGFSLQLYQNQTPPWVFFTFFKLWKWYQTGQRVSFILVTHCFTHTSYSYLFKRKQNLICKNSCPQEYIVQKLLTSLFFVINVIGKSLSKNMQIYDNLIFLNMKFLLRLHIFKILNYFIKSDL